MQPYLWLLVIVVSAGTAFLIVRPLQKKLTALENLCDMLARAIRGDFGEK